MRKSRRLPLLAAVLFLAVFLAGCASHYFRESEKGTCVYLRYRGAKSVFFACSLDRFRLHAAERAGRDLWRVEIPPGSGFSYFYVIDGRTYVPPCPLKERDDFGSENCIYMRGV